MKVKTWVRRYVSSDWIENEKIKKLLLDNYVSHFWTYKEEILDVDLNDIVDTIKETENYEAGYRYCNRLYNLVHSKSKFSLELDDLEYEIIEEGYPENIPWAYCEFIDVDKFHKWMLEEGEKERKEDLKSYYLK